MVCKEKDVDLGILYFLGIFCICVYAKKPHALAASQCKICCKLLSVYKKTFAQLCVCVCLLKASKKLPNAQLQQLCPEVLPFSSPCPSFYLFIFLFKKKKRKKRKK